MSEMAPSQGVPLLRIENLVGGYGDIRILNDISLTIDQGEMLALVGSNGAGKTTLLRTISAILSATSGSIRFMGEEISRASSHEVARLGIAQVPEGRRLFSGMTVEENLRLGAYSRVDKTALTVTRGLEQVFEYFPRLRERRRQLAGTLSGGEQQMCSIGRALMANPRLLMIDELSLGLAPLIVAELVAILRAIHASGTTILLVEQDVSVALQISERAIVLQTGRVVLEGPSSELISKDDIVKSYLGG